MGTRDRQPYLTASTLSQDFLDECASNLECQLELIADIEAPDGTIIRASDRNKYVGGVFYEALCSFPTIQRTLGEWLSTQIEFSSLELTLSNADGRFSKYLPGGSDFKSWIGKEIVVKIGLRDVAASYKEVFKGFITAEGGFRRGTYSITLLARNRWDKLSNQFPNTVFTTATYPMLEADKEGLVIPFILGDWTTNLTHDVSIPAIVVNGNDPNVYDGLRNNIKLVVSINNLTYLNRAKVYVKRGDLMYNISVGDVIITSINYNTFELVQNTGGTIIEGELFKLESGDTFYCQVIGDSLSGYQDNIIAQAQHLLEIFGGVTSGEYDSTWATYKAKNIPSESAIANIKSRIWIQDKVSLIEYVLSLLEQVRLEAFINRDGYLSLNAMHFEEYEASPSFIFSIFDIEKGTFQPNIDEKTNFNRSQGAFNYEPIVKENTQLTPIFRNSNSITQINKEIYKQIVFPNLYVQTDVENQTKEILKLASGFPENITMTTTWRALLLDLGNFATLNVIIDSAYFNNVPVMIREARINPSGVKIEMRLLSFQVINFPGWLPGTSGVVGGYDATITQE